VTTGASAATWSTVVANPVKQHGTHVVGTAVGSGGLSSYVYRGIAPAANLYFYKIGNNTTGATTGTDQIKAINRALFVGCQVFSLSYGDLEAQFLDGSSSVCQAIDYAVNSGMSVFVAAGNGANKNKHRALTVAPGATVPGALTLSVNNTATFTTFTGTIDVRVIWRDDTPGDLNVQIPGQTPTSSGTSPRGTESHLYHLQVTLPPGPTTVIYPLTNVAASGTNPLVHAYCLGVTGNLAPNLVPVTITGATVDTLILHPAVADQAIAVGAWVHRPGWTDYQGTPQSTGFLQGALAPFSSVGPRINGTMKPDLITPGAALISTRNLTLWANPIRRIDNDGQNLNGSGPADYYVHWGTSMACPVAAGAAALLLSVNPGLTPAQVLSALTCTASQATAPDNLAGYGLINVATAMQSLFCNPAPGGLVHAITCTPGPTPFDANITFSASGGMPCTGNMVWIATTGVNAGQVPNGWLNGVNITWAEMTWEIALGAPFLGYLEPFGNYSSTITVFGVPCPLGITLDSVALEFDVLTGSFVQGSTALTSSL
jgi:subtilisin family serine protease